MNNIGYSEHQRAQYRAAGMSGATQVETGYTAAPAPDQHSEVPYEYSQSQLPEPKRGRYGEAFAVQQGNFPGQSKKAIVVDATRLTGRCLWFDARKNYGAIQPDQSLGTEGETGHSYIFVHGNDVEQGSQQLRQGDAVEFCRGTCPRGRPKAVSPVLFRDGSRLGRPRGSLRLATARASLPPSFLVVASREQCVILVGASTGAGYGAAGYPQQQRPLGRVKWFDRERKQYGFITPADGSPDLFVHAGDVLGSTKMLGPGDAVEFDYGVQAQSGRPKALEVVRLVQHVGDDDEDDGRTTIGKFAPGDEPLFEGARVTGTVARFDQQHRWGFIAPDDDTLKPPGGGDNFFLHGLDVLDLSDSNPVDVGQAVEFAVVRSRSRRCKAVQCLRVDPDARQTPPNSSPSQRAASQASSPRSADAAAAPGPADQPLVGPQPPPGTSPSSQPPPPPGDAAATLSPSSADAADQVDTPFKKTSGAQVVAAFSAQPAVAAGAPPADIVVD
ncbi:hypothetical protein CTAYLR_003925 [Chrysophaeum taylorii]|uniref:CSD domain-containing protein n=1 Tax=Chrysophaeum taylorii TaxID=2483200 RepID=A0AAD7UA95_9STRA|nr:hypothetical protein CTAYLR_003925 [Chrysophaeum taylorii]